MSERRFDRDTLLDLTVNVIPLIIILFFFVLYTLYRPLGWDNTIMFFVYVLHIIPFVGLAVLTYLSARVISRDEGNTAAPAPGGTSSDVRAHRDTDDSSQGAGGDGVATENEDETTTTENETAITDEGTPSDEASTDDEAASDEAATDEAATDDDTTSA